MLSARRPGRVVRGLGRAFLGIYLSIYVSKITCHFCPRLPDFRSFVRSGDKLQRSRIPSTLSSWVLAEPPSSAGDRRGAGLGPSARRLLSMAATPLSCFRWRPRPLRSRRRLPPPSAWSAAHSASNTRSKPTSHQVSPKLYSWLSRRNGGQAAGITRAGPFVLFNLPGDTGRHRRLALRPDSVKEPSGNLWQVRPSLTTEPRALVRGRSCTGAAPFARAYRCWASS